MAKPVVVKFIGDSTKLDSTASGAEERIGRFGKRVSSESDDAARGLGRLSESTDNSERNLIGLHDVVDGTAAVMQGPGKIGIAAYIQGWADLAGGVTPLIETVKGMTRETINNAIASARAAGATVRKTAVETIAAVKTRALAIAQGILNAVMSANPIALVVIAIVALIAIFIIAYKRSETFRNIVQGAFRAVKAAASALWDGIKTAFGGIVDAGGKIIDFFRRLPGRVVGFFKDLPGKLRDLGSRLINAFVDGMKAVGGLIVDALSNLIPGPIKSFLHLGSPAKEGPMSEDGGPEHWGEKVAQFFTKGLAKGSEGLPGALRGLPPGFGPGGGMVPAMAGGGHTFNINAQTDADPHDIGREVAWVMRTSGR